MDKQEQKKNNNGAAVAAVEGGILGALVGLGICAGAYAVGYALARFNRS